MSSTPETQEPRSVQQLCYQIERAREMRLEKKNKAWPKSNTYASSIPVCARQGVYEFLAWDQKKPFETRLLARFEEGERQEHWVIKELSDIGQDLGFRVVEEQVPLHADMITHYRLSGKIDGKIEFDNRRRVPFECKSMHPMFFDNVKTVDDLTHDAFLARYYRQMQAYMYGHHETECILVLTDCLGHWRFIVIPQDLKATQEFLDTLEKVNFFVDENHGQTDPEKWKLPERIDYDPDICGKCNFNHICLPDVINKSRVRFANDQELAHDIERHEELRESAADYKKLHEKLAEYFKGKRESLIVVGDAPSFVITGKMTKGRPSLAPEEEWAADELAQFQKLKEKYTNQEPGWSWSVDRQDGPPAVNVAPQQPIAASKPTITEPKEPVLPVAPPADLEDAVATVFGPSASPREKLDVTTSPHPKPGAAEAAVRTADFARTGKPKIKIV